MFSYENQFKPLSIILYPKFTVNFLVFFPKDTTKHLENQLNNHAKEAKKDRGKREIGNGMQWKKLALEEEEECKKLVIQKL